jgi:hypothetical protein
MKLQQNFSPLLPIFHFRQTPKQASQQPLHQQLNQFFLLETFPSFPYQKQVRKPACFEDPVDFCCDSIQRDCRWGIFSVVRKKKGHINFDKSSENCRRTDLRWDVQNNQFSNHRVTNQAASEAERLCSANVSLGKIMFEKLLWKRKMNF